MADSVIRQLGATYHEFVRTHPDVKQTLVEVFEDLFSDAGITFDRVTARIKTWASLKSKAQRVTPAGTPEYPDPWESIHDILGVRITTFHSTEIPKAVEVLSQTFSVVRSVDKAAETRLTGEFGYGSHHVIIRLGDEIEELRDYRSMLVEIQIRTVLQHAWAEFEHDIRYKNGSPDLDPAVDRAFTLAAGLIELADQQFDKIAQLQSPQNETPADVELTAETLPGVLAMLLGNRFPTARSSYYQWLVELLSAHDITTVRDLQELANESALSKLLDTMHYRFTPAHARLIDDLLLARFHEDHITKTGSTGNRPRQRVHQLRERLEILRHSNLPLSKNPENPGA